MTPDGPERVVIHASLRGLASGVCTPLALGGLGAAALATGGLMLLPAALLVLGVGLGVIVLLDLPRRVDFDRAGLTRVCWLRRQRVPWSEVVAIERTRPSTTSVARNAMNRDGVPGSQVVSGGLVARGAGKRRWLLTDRIESREEHDRLRALLRSAEAPVALRAARPHEAAPPTDLYRRRDRR